VCYCPGFAFGGVSHDGSLTPRRWAGVRYDSFHIIQ
jgi:hypothetical protein